MPVTNKARWADLQEANKIIAEDMGVAPVYQKAEGHLVNPKVKGIVHHLCWRIMGLQMDIY